MKAPVHPALLPAVSASVDEVAATVLNPAAETLSPAMQAFIDLLHGLRFDLDAANTTIADLRQQLAGKASASTLNTLSQRVTTLSATLDTKAATAYVDQQVHAIGDVDADQASAIAAIKQTLTGEGADLKTLFANQASQKLLLDGLRTDVDQKAPQVTVSAQAGQLTTLRNTVNDASTGLAATKAVADAAASQAATANVEVAKRLQLAGGTMNPGAVVIGLGVPKAASMDKAVQKSELTGGLQQPYRFFLDVQAAPVTAFVRTNERVDIGDDNGTGQVLVLTSLTITNTGTTQVATTVTITAKTASGAVVFTQGIPVVLTSAPAVGKTLDLLSLLTTPPADIALTEPIYFFVSATAGKYTVRLEGKKR